MIIPSIVFFGLAVGFGVLAGFFLKFGIAIGLVIVLAVIVAWLFGYGGKQPAEGGLPFGILGVFLFVAVISMGITAFAVRPETAKAVSSGSEQAQSFLKQHILR